MCPPPPSFHKLLYKLLTTLDVVSNCAPPIKKSFLRHCMPTPFSLILSCNGCLYTTCLHHSLSFSHAMVIFILHPFIILSLLVHFIGSHNTLTFSFHRTPNAFTIFLSHCFHTMPATLSTHTPFFSHSLTHLPCIDIVFIYCSPSLSSSLSSSHTHSHTHTGSNRPSWLTRSSWSTSKC